MLLIIFFYRRGLPVLGVSKCRHSGFECFRPLCCNPCVLFRAYGAAARKSGQRRSYRACCSVRPCREAEACRMEGRACCFARSCRVADGGAPSGSGGLAGRRMEGPAAVLDGGGGVSGGMAGLAVSDGRVGQLSRRTADGPGGVGDLLCRMRAVGACPCPCPCPCLPANRMSAAEKRRRNLSLPARKRIFEGH